MVIARRNEVKELPAGIMRFYVVGSRWSAHQQSGFALSQISQCAVKLCFFSGSQSRPATIVLAGSNRSGSGGNEIARAFDGKGRFGDSASLWAVTRVNAEQASKRVMWEPTRLSNGEGQCCWGSERYKHPVVPPG